MAALFPVLPGQETDQASVMSWGCDPDALSADPFTGPVPAVISSMAKIVAAGADYRKAYLTLQEFFEKLRDEPRRWGKPFSALLGALTAQLELGAAAIGGKDSMSGSFLDLDVPPTLISFAIAPVKAGEILSPEFKEAGHPVFLFAPADDSAESSKAVWEQFHALCQAGKVRAAWAVENGLAEAVMKMSFGNQIGFRAEGEADRDWYVPHVGALVAELTESAACGVKLGVTTAEPVIDLGADAAPIDELLTLNEAVLEDVYPNRAAAEPAAVPVLEAPAFTRAAPKAGVKQPRVLIPVFPGTNCEYDSARAVLRAGLTPEILVVNNQSSQDVAESVRRFAKAARDSQIIFLPGGFSGGDEPDGSGKFITAFFRNPEVSDATMDLLKKRDGLMLGICNGFQALIKLGLVPYGEIIDTDETCPTLTFNVIGRHQSRIVRTRVASNRSPWLCRVQVGDVVSVPISHGEGRFLCSEELLEQAGGKRADRHPVCGSLRRADAWTSRAIPTAPSGLWRASPAPTGGSWARWATRSGSARRCTRTSPAIMTCGCLTPPRTISVLNTAMPPSRDAGLWAGDPGPVQDMLLRESPGFRADLDIQHYETEFQSLESKYAPPDGRLYPARADGQSAGCIALRKLDRDICELKHLYVRPAFRGQGTAPALVCQLLEDTRAIVGYRRMRPLPFLREAVALHRKIGFTDIPCYNNSPMAETISLQLELSSLPAKSLK